MLNLLRQCLGTTTTTTTLFIYPTCIITITINNIIVTWGFMKDHILINPYVSFEGNHLTPASGVLQFPYPDVSFLLVRPVDLVVVLVRSLSCRNLVVNYGASVNKAEFVCVMDVWLTRSLSWGFGV